MEYKEGINDFKATGWAFLVPFGLVLPVYCFAFYKAIKGTRYKVLLLLLTFLTISIVCNIFVGVASLMEFSYLNKVEIRDPSTWKEFYSFENWLKASNVVTFVAVLFFNEAHWIFASYYFKIAKNMPRMIDGHLDQVKSYACLKWVGIYINALLPVIAGILNYALRMD